jgi:hypothetical protein
MTEVRVYQRIVDMVNGDKTVEEIKQYIDAEIKTIEQNPDLGPHINNILDGIKKKLNFEIEDLNKPLPIEVTTNSFGFELPDTDKELIKAKIDLDYSLLLKDTSKIKNAQNRIKNAQNRIQSVKDDENRKVKDQRQIKIQIYEVIQQYIESSKKYRANGGTKRRDQTRSAKKSRKQKRRVRKSRRNRRR